MDSIPWVRCASGNVYLPDPSIIDGITKMINCENINAKNKWTVHCLLYLWRDIKLNHNFYTDPDLPPIPLQNSFRVQVAWDVNLRQQVKARRDESEKDDFCNRFSVTDIQGDSDELRRAQGRKCTSCSLGSPTDLKVQK